jgi:hypothetical protein
MYTNFFNKFGGIYSFENCPWLVYAFEKFACDTVLPLHAWAYCLEKTLSPTVEENSGNGRKKLNNSLNFFIKDMHYF